jgi:metal-responsive CopG/Arc/MetJ family transcriptional regulator
MAEYPQIGVRMDEGFLKRLDEWRRNQDDLPSRPEAIRRLCELGLGGYATLPKTEKHSQDEKTGKRAK